jgi:sugar phosphate isomerase/epimerase
MGYSFVEFAGFMGLSAKEIRKMLDDDGLYVSGTHTGWQEVANDFDKTVEYHKTIGNKNIIIPGADLGTKAKLDAFIDFINEYQPKLAAQGITLGYHNHSHEFQPTPEGYLIHTELEKRTKVNFEIDTYWAYVAGLDPVATVTRLKDRVHVIHLKDGSREGQGSSLGLGTAPVAAVRKLAIDLGITIVVESENLQPDGISEVKRCIDWLKAQDAADGK